MFNNLYKTMVRPHLEYASVIWNPHHKRLKVLLENVQRRATRMLKGLRLSKMSYNKRMLKLGIPSLAYRRTRSDILQVYWLIQNIDIVPSDIINMTGQTVTRGHKFKLLKKNMKTNRYKNCFSKRVVNDWNSLPKALIEASSLNSFKNIINKKIDPECYRTYI